MNDSRRKFIEQAIAERSAQSATVSSQVRSISIGILALTWLFLSGTQPTISSKFASDTTQLLIIAILCLLALTFDFLQYIFALLETDSAINEAERGMPQEGSTDPDDGDFGYTVNDTRRIFVTALFWMKIIQLISASCWIIILMIYRVT